VFKKKRLINFLAVNTFAFVMSAYAVPPPDFPPDLTENVPPPPVPDFRNSPYWPWKDPNGSGIVPDSTPKYYAPGPGGNCSLQILVHSDFGEWVPKDACKTIPGSEKSCIWPDGNTLPQSLMGILRKEIEAFENSYMCFKDAEPPLGWEAKPNDSPNADPPYTITPPAPSEGYDEMCASIAKVALCRWYFGDKFMNDGGGRKGGFACEDARINFNDPSMRLQPIIGPNGEVVGCGESRRALCRRRTQSCAARALLEFEQGASGGVQAAAKYCGGDFFWAHEPVIPDGNGGWKPLNNPPKPPGVGAHRKATRRIVCKRSETKGIICYFSTLSEMTTKHPLKRSCWETWRRDNNIPAGQPDQDGQFKLMFEEEQ
jgi:hypothetical protein